MKILSLIELALASDAGADFVLIDLDALRAEQMLRQYQGFCKLRELPGPKPLWMTILEDRNITFYLSRGTIPQFEGLRTSCRDGYTVLPDAFPYDADSVKAAIVPGVKPHMIISEDGVSWHALLRNGAHHATAVLPPSLLERAIGITLAPVSSSPSS